jgi:hypothetical protein
MFSIYINTGLLSQASRGHCHLGAAEAGDY